MTEPPKPIERKIIAGPEDYQPLSKGNKTIGAFNPAAIQIKTKNGIETLIMIRVAEQPIGIDSNKIFLPYFNIPNKENNEVNMKFDEYNKSDLLENENKYVKLPNGQIKSKHISLPRILTLDKKTEIIERSQKPAVFPTSEQDRFGMEDFRITPLGEKFVLTYVTPHRQSGVSTSILMTENFKDYIRFPDKDTSRPIITGIKDVIFFPEKVPSPYKTELIEKGSLMHLAFVRPNAFSDISPAGIWVAYSPDLVHWGPSYRLTSENSPTTGSGTPPIKVDNNWLAAYHETTKNSDGESVYKTRLMRLNLKEPWKDFKTSKVLLERKDYLEMLPTKGYIPNVVFSSGITSNKEITTIFSGIDDTWTVMDKFYTKDLTKFLSKS